MQTLREVRHALRGRLNALKLCTSALPLAESQEESMEYLDQIEQATDKIVAALDQLEEIVHETDAAHQ
jgi:hypothetical protein